MQSADCILSPMQSADCGGSQIACNRDITLVVKKEGGEGGILYIQHNTPWEIISSKLGASFPQYSIDIYPSLMMVFSTGSFPKESLQSLVTPCTCTKY